MPAEAVECSIIPSVQAPEKPIGRASSRTFVAPQSAIEARGEPAGAAGDVDEWRIFSLARSGGGEIGELIGQRM